MRSCSESGQATVEAAVMLPLLLIVFGLFAQPAILLYNESVMTAAAAEGCRLVATSTTSDAAVESYVKRRLAGIPDMAVFHMGGSEGWEISFAGPDERGESSVKVVNRSRPLPLFGVTAGLSGNIDSNGEVRQSAEVKSPCIPAWACKEGTHSADWIGEWE